MFFIVVYIVVYGMLVGFGSGVLVEFGVIFVYFMRGPGGPARCWSLCCLSWHLRWSE